MDYPCHSPEEKRWFYMRAIRVADSKPSRVVISHENITPLKLAELKIRQREEELEQKSRRLENANAALRVFTVPVMGCPLRCRPFTVISRALTRNS